MPIIKAKCCVLIGAAHPLTRYVVRGREIPVVTQQVDLGVVHLAALHSGDNWKKAACRGFHMMWFIRRSFGVLTADFFVKLFSASVRPHLEYCIQAFTMSNRRKNGFGEDVTSEHSVNAGSTGTDVS
ncbi:unnamed protein product [Dicrocoelium dendriticum]|nr:unnamed protein product [Dicrocoelium dendriticum]